MCYSSLADFLEELERLGQLRSVETGVDLGGDPSTIGSYLAQSNGKTTLFHDVRGSGIPLVVGLFETEARIAAALAVERMDEIAERVERSLARRERRKTRHADDESPRLEACPEGNVSAGLPNHVEHSATSRQSQPDPDYCFFMEFAPRAAKIGACQKVVRLGEDVDLTRLPVPRGPAGQNYPVITAGQLVSRDPVSGRLLVGHAELSIRSGRELAVHWSVHDPLAGLLTVYRRRGEAMPLAIVLGGPPSCLLAALAPLPLPVDRWALAGLLAGRSLDVVRCRTLDLEVPAEAELVLEGTIDPAAANVETGPLAVPEGRLAASRPAPIMRVGALTHRANPVFPAMIHGAGSREWVSIVRAMQNILLPLLRIAIPELSDAHLPECGHGRRLAWVSIRKSDDSAAAARRVARSLWELPATQFCRLMVLVDESVDVHDPQQVWAAVAANMEPRRDTILDDGPPDPWDPGAGAATCPRMALDATVKRHE
ncbi:MAG: UbiD family decarboxylase [Pirellulales bacterium]|nr:UbiD family decarboxylase [Pirellulales bacterium]